MSKIKTAIITGGGGFLATTYAEALLKNNLNVILADINNEKLEKNFNYLIRKKFNKKKIFRYIMDVTDEKNVKEVSKNIYRKFNNVDILINNAAIDHKVNSSGKLDFDGRFENTNLNKLNNEIQVGLFGYLICSKIFGVKMAKNKNGVIINIASDLSVIAPNQDIYDKKQKKPISYSIIKTSVVGLTKYLAAYWAKKNVRVNAISPGPIFNGQPKKFVNKLRKLIPMERMCDKYELKSSIEFLCSDSSTYITGHNLIIDGGRTII